MARLLLLSLAVVCAAVCRLGAENIKPGYYPAGGERGMCYRPMGGPGRRGWANWEGAKAACERQGAKLATYVDAQEHAGLMRAVRATKVFNNRWNFWLGVSDRFSAGNWITTDGDAITKYMSSTWQYRRPWRFTHQYTGNTIGVRCAMRWDNTNRLIDFWCERALPYACMYQCQPEKAKKVKAAAHKKFYTQAGDKGKCFKAVYKMMTQPQASQYCKGEGAQLATFSDDAEMEHLKMLMRHEPNGKVSFHIDGTDAKKEGDWQMSNGCTWAGYFKEILNTRVNPAASDCAHLYFNKANDLPVVAHGACSTKRRFACMYQCEGEQADQCAPKPIAAEREVKKTADQLGPIRAGYYRAGGKRGMCYRLMGAAKKRGWANWSTAKWSCAAQGAQLATYVDAQEHAGLMRAVRATKHFNNGWSFWLGINDVFSAGNWITIADGRPLNPYVHSTWQQYRPARHNKHYTSDLHGVRCGLRWGRNDRLMDGWCHSVIPYACMYQCEPEKADAPQPEEYKPFYSAGGSGGKCFKSVFKLMTQAAASAYCAAEGAQLAYLSDREEMEHLRTLMRNERGATVSFFLDGTDAAKEGHFKYSDGCTLDGYMKELLAQSADPVHRDCVSIYYKAKSLIPLVDNADCRTPHRFACMYQCGAAAAGAKKKTCAGGEGGAATTIATTAAATKAPVQTTAKQTQTTVKQTQKPTAAFKPGYNTAPHGKRGMCYKARPEKMTNEQAAAQCAKDGATLANFVDEAEWQYLVFLKAIKDSNYWLDGSDLKSKGKFTFSDGTDFAHANTKFSEGNPDNWRGMESCLATDGKGQNTLNDSYCANKFFFFCMYKCQ